MRRSIFLPRGERAVWAIAAALCVLLLLPFPYRDVLLVTAAVGCAAFAARHFETVWLAVLTLLPLIRLSGGLFGYNGMTLSRILVVALAGVFLITMRDASVLRSLWKTNGVRWFGLFIAVNLVSAVYVFKTSAVLTTLTYLEPLLFFAVSYCLIRLERLTVRAMLRAILLGAVLVAAGGFYEWAVQQPLGKIFNPELRTMLDIYMFGYDSNRFGLGGRLSSFIAQPVFAGLYWVMVLTIAVYYFKVGPRARWFQIAWVLMALLFLVLSGTRGGLLALAAVFGAWLVFGLQNWRQRAIALGMAGAGLLGILLLSPALANYLRASFELRPDSIAARNVIWRVAVTGGLLDVFKNHWLLGYGPGLVQKQSQAGEIPKIVGMYPLGGLENQYATILADGGIFAGLAYVLFMAGALQDSVRLLRQSAGHARGVLLLVLFAAYFVFAATVMTVTAIPSLLLMAVYGACIADFENGAPRAHIPLAHD